MLIILVFNTLFLIWVILVGFPQSRYFRAFTLFFFNSDCYPQVEAEGSDSCRPRPEALESSKGQIPSHVGLGLVYFGLFVWVWLSSEGNRKRYFCFAWIGLVWNGLESNNDECPSDYYP